MIVCVCLRRQYKYHRVQKTADTASFKCGAAAERSTAAAWLRFINLQLLLESTTCEPVVEMKINFDPKRMYGLGQIGATNEMG